MPAKGAYPDDILRMAATLYYVDGLGQTEVANLVRVSQTKISRLLASPSPRRTIREKASTTVKRLPSGRAISRRQLLVPRSSAA